MPNAAERLVNLALYFASARGPVSVADVRRDVVGYPEGQDEEAFLRMFERDKDELRAAGLALRTDPDDASAYALDPEATYARAVTLAPDEIAAVRAAAAALSADPAFPFPDDLRRAALKLLTRLDEPALPAGCGLADEAPAEQGRAAAQLNAAIAARKRARFDYTNSLGRRGRHEIEPYGLFLREGRWYAVGRDVDLDAVRTYSLTRMENLEVEAARPKQPDFERPDGFDVASFVRLPFQYGPETFEAAVRFSPDASWLLAALSEHGSLHPDGDDTVWRVTAADRRRLLQWVVENGPGITIAEPAELRLALTSAMREVAEHHGG